MAVTSIDRTLLGFEFADGVAREGRLEHRYKSLEAGWKNLPFNISILGSAFHVDWIDHGFDAGPRHEVIVGVDGHEIHGLGWHQKHTVDLRFDGVTPDDVKISSVLGVLEGVALVDMSKEEGFSPSYQEIGDGVYKLLVPTAVGEIALYLNESPSVAE